MSLRSFVFQENNGTERPPNPYAEEETFGILDSLIDGVALPGKWGVLQALFNIWTKEQHGHPALFYSRLSLDTVAALLKYHRSLKPPEPTVAAEDPTMQYLRVRKLQIPHVFELLSHFIYTYAKMHSYQDLELTRKPVLETATSHRELLRVFRLPSGVEYVYRLHIWADSNDEFHAGRFTGAGPYVRIDQHAQFLEEVHQIIWNAEGGNDLQLAARRVNNTYGGNNHSFSLTNIGEPDSFVSGDTTWQNLDKLANRCTAFQQKGITRKIIFHGPPGTGKTTLARSLARKLGNGQTLRIEASAIEIAGSQAIMQFLNVLRPRTILFDDLDRCMEAAVEILHYMEQIGRETQKQFATAWSSGMVVIGTVNSIHALDPALLRPGRFDEVVTIPEPIKEHREAIIRFYIEKFDVQVNTETLIHLIERMDGFSPADIREVLQCGATVGMEHVEIEIERVRLQRGFYSGDACDAYMAQRPSGKYLAATKMLK